jgi:hypothetical protein
VRLEQSQEASADGAKAGYSKSQRRAHRSLIQ